MKNNYNRKKLLGYSTIILFVFSFSVVSAQTNFGAHVGYEFLPSSYFTPSGEASFNPSLFDMESFVTYSGNVSPSVGIQMEHKLSRSTYLKMSADYVYNSVDYQVSNNKYWFLYEGDEGQLSLENHAVNISGLLGVNLSNRRNKKSKVVLYGGGFIGRNFKQDLKVPESKYKNNNNFYFLREYGVNPIVYGGEINLSLKLVYQGAGRRAKHVNFDLFTKIYSDGLIAAPSDDTRVITSTGIKVGFEI